MTFSAFTKYLAGLAAVVTLIAGLGLMTGMNLLVPEASAQQTGHVPGNPECPRRCADPVGRG